MNQTRKLLTLLAMVAFIVIIFTVGYNQWPHANLQIEFGRGRVWGLTPLGNALAILVVIYAGLFAISNDDRFLMRHSRAVKRLAIALIILCVVAVGGKAIIDEARRISERAAMHAESEQKRKAARTDWEAMTPQDRAYMKLYAGSGAVPVDLKERERVENIKIFVPEFHQPLTDEEAGLIRAHAAEQQAAPTATPTPTTP